MTLTQLLNESVTTRSRRFANRFNYARDMCHGTIMHPVIVRAIFEPGKSQKADGLTKVLTSALMKHLCWTWVWHLSLTSVLLLRSSQSTILVKKLVSRRYPGLISIGSSELADLLSQPAPSVSPEVHNTKRCGTC